MKRLIILFALLIAMPCEARMNVGIVGGGVSGGSACSTSSFSYTDATEGFNPTATWGTRWISNAFTTTEGATICKAIVRLKKSGSSPAVNYRFCLYSNNSGVPTAPASSGRLGCSDYVAGSTLSTSEGDVTFSNMSVALSTSTVYHGVLESDGYDETYTVDWAYDTTYVENNMCTSIDDGGSWSVDTSKRGKMVLYK